MAAEEAQGAQGPQLGLGALQNAFHNIQMELRAGRMGKRIPDFNGDGSRRFKEWLADIERIAGALNADDATIKALCFESLKGSAAEHFARVNRNHPNAQWRDIRRALVAQYSDAGDSHIAIQRLRQIKQKRGESIQSFAERIRTLGQEAYPNQQGNNPLVQDSLIEALIDGVVDDHIARKLIRERPDDFEDAVVRAIREQQASKHFSMRRNVYARNEEPMDVNSVVQPRLADKVDQLCDQLEKLMPAPKPEEPSNPIEDVLAKVENLERKISQNFGGQARGGQKDRRQWTPDGKPICLYCNIPGHIQRDCRKRKMNQKHKQQSN